MYEINSTNTIRETTAPAKPVSFAVTVPLPPNKSRQLNSAAAAQTACLQRVHLSREPFQSSIAAATCI
jgi:hypothetical protein